jgi:hypothetical protein
MAAIAMGLFDRLNDGTDFAMVGNGSARKPRRALTVVNFKAGAGGSSQY